MLKSFTTSAKFSSLKAVQKTDIKERIPWQFTVKSILNFDNFLLHISLFKELSQKKKYPDDLPLKTTSDKTFVTFQTVQRTVAKKNKKTYFQK